MAKHIIVGTLGILPPEERDLEKVEKLYRYDDRNRS